MPQCGLRHPLKTVSRVKLSFPWIQELNGRGVEGFRRNDIFEIEKIRQIRRLIFSLILRFIL